MLWQDDANNKMRIRITAESFFITIQRIECGYAGSQMNDPDGYRFSGIKADTHIPGTAKF